MNIIMKINKYMSANVAVASIYDDNSIQAVTEKFWLGVNYGFNNSSIVQEIPFEIIFKGFLFYIFKLIHLALSNKHYKWFSILKRRMANNTTRLYVIFNYLFIVRYSLQNSLTITSNQRGWVQILLTFSIKIYEKCTVFIGF
jgi:hypothetical protein